MTSSGSRARSPASQPGARPHRLEHDLHRATVIGADIVHGEGAAAQHRALQAAHGDRDELAGPEPGRDGRGDQRQRVVGIDPARRQHGGPRPGPPPRLPHSRDTRSCAACSCSDRTPTSPRMMASMPCTAAARPGHGGHARDTAADRGGTDLIAVEPGPGLAGAAERRVHDQVHLTGENPGHHGRLAVGPGPSPCFRTILARTPLRRSTSAVPSVAQDLEAQVGQPLDREDHGPLVPVGDRDEHPAL